MVNRDVRRLVFIVLLVALAAWGLAVQHYSIDIFSFNFTRGEDDGPLGLTLGLDPAGRRPAHLRGRRGRRHRVPDGGRTGEDRAPYQRLRRDGTEHPAARRQPHPQSSCPVWKTSRRPSASSVRQASWSSRNAFALTPPARNSPTKTSDSPVSSLPAPTPAPTRPAGNPSLT